MDRRQLLQGFAAAASGLLTPEPVRRYFFAPKGGWARVFRGQIFTSESHMVDFSGEHPEEFVFTGEQWSLVRAAAIMPFVGSIDGIPLRVGDIIQLARMKILVGEGHA